MKDIKNFKTILYYLRNKKVMLIIYIILILLLNLTPVVKAYLWANAFQELIDGNKYGFTMYILLEGVIFVIIFPIITALSGIIYTKLENKFIENVNKDLYKKITKLPAIAFEDYSVGEFINRLNSDPDRILELLNKLIKLTGNLFIGIFIVILSFTISIKVGLEFVLLCVVMFIFANIYYPKIKKYQKEIKKESDGYVKVATQNISGIREIKSLGIEDNIINRINKIIESLFKKQIKIGNTETIYYALNNCSYIFITLLILTTMGYQLLQGDINLVSFVLLEEFIGRINKIVESLSEFGVAYNKVTVSLKRINEILKNELFDDEKFGNKEIINEKYNIKFKDVVFKYRDTDKYNILKGLNLTLEPNKKIAIVGKSGQGKSTLFNLLLRYFDCNKGTIKIDNIDIKDLSEKSLRDNISIIRQAPYLFNTTIVDNFKVVKEDVTLEEIRDVCKKAYIDDYIMSLPEKYDTIIGEGGVNLSGGQKQRLAIARTLLKNTKVILFDEATSALDNESQEYIKKTIDDLVKDHMIIIVAHRLSTIIDADIIYVISDGKMEACGTNEELLKNSDLYRKLYNPEVLDI